MLPQQNKQDKTSLHENFVVVNYNHSYRTIQCNNQPPTGAAFFLTRDYGKYSKNHDNGNARIHNATYCMIQQNTILQQRQQ